MDIETLESLAAILQDSTANRLSISGAEWAVELERPNGSSAPDTRAAPPTADVAPTEVHPTPEPVTQDVTAGMVGVFHTLLPAVAVGDMIAEGDVLGSIESLAIRTDVRSGATGRIVAAQVEDGQPVEYGQPLFSIVPAQEL